MRCNTTSPTNTMSDIPVGADAGDRSVRNKSYSSTSTRAKMVDKAVSDSKCSSFMGEEDTDDSDAYTDAQTEVTEVSEVYADAQTEAEIENPLEELDRLTVVEDREWTEEAIEEAFIRADRLKAEGNEFFKLKSYDSAIDLYTECLESCPKGDKRLSVFYSNRAACYLALKNYDAVVKDCTLALELNEMYVKALVRRAQGYEGLEKLEEALDDFKKVVELEPTAAVAVEGTKRLPPLITAKQDKLKEEMMGKLKDLGNTVLGKFGMSLDAFKMVQQPDGSYSVAYNP
eukprot:CFRG1245T1